MITRWEILTRKATLEAADFITWWHENHGALELNYAGLQHLIHNTVTDAQQRGVDFPRCRIDTDALSELWFNDLRAMTQACQSHATQIADSYRHFTDQVHTLVTIKNSVIPIADGPLLKRLSFIQRSSDITPEQFKYEWWDVHSDYVRKFQGVRGYCQSLVLERLTDGQSVSDTELPIDGIVELYFDDLSALQTDFASQAGQTAQKHGHTFLQAVSTYIVEKNVLKA